MLPDPLVSEVKKLRLLAAQMAMGRASEVTRELKGVLELLRNRVVRTRDIEAALRAVRATADALGESMTLPVADDELVIRSKANLRIDLFKAIDVLERELGPAKPSDWSVVTGQGRCGTDGLGGRFSYRCRMLGRCSRNVDAGTTLNTFADYVLIAYAVAFLVTVGWLACLPKDRV